MATLSQCPVCSGKVASDAYTCPHCHAELRNELKEFGKLFLKGFVVVAICSLMTGIIIVVSTQSG